MITTLGYYSLSVSDSRMYDIKTEDVYEEFSKDGAIFDFSNYSTKLKIMIIQLN